MENVLTFGNGTQKMSRISKTWSNGDGTWMSFQQYSNNYKIKTNFLMYLGVLSAVKHASGRLWVDLSIKPSVYFESRVFKVSIR